MIGIDMEMPACCGKCRFATAFECSVNRKFITNHDKKSAHCPLVALNRPKGMWKLVYRDNQDIDIVCPFCNSIRFPAYSHGYTIEELEEYLIRQHLPNFCEDCGADLRKGGADMRGKEE